MIALNVLELLYRTRIPLKFGRYCINLMIALDIVEILIIHILIHEHGISFYLFVFSLSL
jgi:hypothetical protein